MTLRRGFVVLALATVLGCDPSVRSVPCLTYVAGGFNRENHFAMAIEGDKWPRLDASSRIELTLLLASGKSQPVELVHVVGDHEIERWALDVSTEDGRMPVCTIGADPKWSTCGANIHVSPHDPGGYWYLRSGNDVLEAGMSFVICRAGVAAVAPPATPPTTLRAPAQ